MPFCTIELEGNIFIEYIYIVIRYNTERIICYAIKSQGIIKLLANSTGKQLSSALTFRASYKACYVTFLTLTEGNKSNVIFNVVTNF